MVIPSIYEDNLPKVLESSYEADQIIPVTDRNMCVIDAENYGYKRAIGDVIVLGCDRVVFRKGWRRELEKALLKIDNSGVVNFLPSSHVGVGAVTRDYIEKIQGGYFAFTDYIHYFMDLEMGEKSRKLLKYTSVLEYVDIIPKSSFKRVKVSENTSTTWDDETYYLRESQGFPPYTIRDQGERNKYANFYKL